MTSTVEHTATTTTATTTTATTTSVNPWTWQEALGYSQGVLVEHPRRTLHLAGQCSVGPDGAPRHPGDMAAQAQQAMANVKAVLDAAGLTLADVVRYDVYTTDIGSYLTCAHQDVAGAFVQAGVLPAGGILAQVQALAMPGLLLEVVVTAAR